MKVYLIGATGHLGAAVYSQLRVEKIDLVPVVRKQSIMKKEVVSDFSVESLRKIFKDADVIINAAGSVKTYDRKELWKANVELVQNIAAAAPEKAKIIHASSISVYGKQLAKKPADEQTPVKPDSDYARSKYEAEKALTGHANTVILRIGTVYDATADYENVMERIKLGKMLLIGDGNNCIPFVYIDDVASVFVQALKAPAGVYNIVGDRITQQEVYNIAAEVLGAQPPSKHVSFWLANAKAFIDEKFAKILGKKPKITREHVAVLYFDRPFDCSAARKLLKFNPRSNADGVRLVAKKIKANINTSLH